MKLNIINDYNPKLTYNLNSFKKITKKILNDFNVKDINLSIILSNKNLLNKLKKDYFNLNHFTDVIAFNLEEGRNPLDGEIYISIDDVLENSEQYKVTFNDEFKRVIIHGLLHLLGFKDETNKQKNKMTKLENINMTFISKEIISLK